MKQIKLTVLVAAGLMTVAVGVTVAGVRAVTRAPESSKSKAWHTIEYSKEAPEITGFEVLSDTYEMADNKGRILDLKFSGKNFPFRCGAGNDGVKRCTESTKMFAISVDGRCDPSILGCLPGGQYHLNQVHNPYSGEEAVSKEPTSSAYYNKIHLTTCMLRNGTDPSSVFCLDRIPPGEYYFSIGFKDAKGVPTNFVRVSIPKVPGITTGVVMPPGK
jgi:hypothetical protein